MTFHFFGIPFVSQFDLYPTSHIVAPNRVKSQLGVIVLVGLRLGGYKA